MPIIRHNFGTTSDGTTIERYTLTNAHGVEADIMTFGGIIIALRVPDRNGQLGDVALGFDTLAPYLDKNPFFGALVGRYGNRIANGRFELDGKTYKLAQNDGKNQLHGGPGGFHQKVWAAQPHDAAEPSLELSIISPDGEEGYPGNLSVTVVYTLTDRNELRIDYTATTDQDTVINLTNHSYFNLAGGGDILEHEMQLFASRFIPINDNLIPTGEIRSVEGTPMDFRTPTPIGARINEDNEQLRNGQGYDHCWVLDKQPGALGHAAHVYDPASGRTLDVFTTEPGVQFYSGNMLNGSLTGKNGEVYARRTGFCLETEHFPDSPNQPQFPSTVLRPGETYQQTTIFRFGVQGKQHAS